MKVLVVHNEFMMVPTGSRNDGNSGEPVMKGVLVEVVVGEEETKKKLSALYVFIL